MPELTVATDAPRSRAGQPGEPGSCARRVPTSSRSRVSRSSSPLRPPVSPITPPLNVTPQLPGADGGVPQTSLPPPSAGPDFSLGRPALAPPLSQPDHSVVGGVVPGPVPDPIVFEENTDVLALQSAISILQMQRAKATADMQALSRAKKAALADPVAFATDLAAGRVRTEGDLLFVGARDEPSDESSSSEEDKDGELDGVAGDRSPPGGRSGPEDVKMKNAESNAEAPAELGESSETGVAAAAAAAATAQTGARRKRKGKEKNRAGHSSAADVGPKSWWKLPKPQNIVRCPPINWAQYGIVGESFDKLHAEQIAAPAQGSPAVLGPSGTFQFRAGDPISSNGDQRRLVGVAAPFNPGRDKLEKKKGTRR